MRPFAPQSSGFAKPTRTDSSCAHASVSHRQVRRGSRFPSQTSPLADPERPYNLYWLMSYNPEARDLASEWRNFQLRETQTAGSPSPISSSTLYFWIELL